MLRSWLLAAVLAGSLVTAGCFGVLGEEPTPSSPVASPTGTPELTRSPVPTGTVSPTATVPPTPAAIPRPPAASGVVNGSPAQIADAHHRRLRNVSFRLRYVSRRVRNGNVTFRSTATVQYDGNGTLSYDYTSVDPDDESTIRNHVQVWSNGTASLRRATTGNETTVEEGSVSDVPTFADRLEIYLKAFRTEVSGYSRLGGESTVRLSADRLGRLGPAREFTLRDYAFRLGIRDLRDGEFSADFVGDTVRRYHLRLFGRTLNGSISLTEELVFTGVGTTTVPRPAWVTAGNGSRGG